MISFQDGGQSQNWFSLLVLAFERGAANCLRYRQFLDHSTPGSSGTCNVRLICKNLTKRDLEQFIQSVLGPTGSGVCNPFFLCQVHFIRTEYVWWARIRWNRRDQGRRRFPLGSHRTWQYTGGRPWRMSCSSSSSVYMISMLPFTLRLETQEPGYYESGCEHWKLQFSKENKLFTFLVSRTEWNSFSVSRCDNWYGSSIRKILMAVMTLSELQPLERNASWPLMKCVSEWGNEKDMPTVAEARLLGHAFAHSEYHLRNGFLSMWKGWAGKKMEKWNWDLAACSHDRYLGGLDTRRKFGWMHPNEGVPGHGHCILASYAAWWSCIRHIFSARGLQCSCTGYMSQNGHLELNGP